MFDVARRVRPHPDKLRTLPTLATQSAVMGIVWELKLVTHDTRYWLCTRGSGGERSPFVPGRVIAERVTPKPAGEHELLEYGPEDAAELQGIDYIHGLTEQIQDLGRQQRDAYSHARAKELDAARRDLHLALVALGLEAPTDSRR